MEDFVKFLPFFFFFFFGDAHNNNTKSLETSIDIRYFTM